jgi:hypothetical protein
MLPEEVKAGKSRIAFVTLKWFQSHVYVHMASQALPAAKILSTRIAGTPFSVGHLYVLVVSGSLSKSLVTVHTLEPPWSIQTNHAGDLQANLEAIATPTTEKDNDSTTDEAKTIHGCQPMCAKCDRAQGKCNF